MITVSKTFESEAEAAAWLNGSNGGSATIALAKPKKKTGLDALMGGTDDEEEPEEEVTKEMILAKATTLAEAGKSKKIQALFPTFGVDGLGKLKEAQYGPFMKELAKIG
jgi:hypothetical protein